MTDPEDRTDEDRPEDEPSGDLLEDVDAPVDESPVDAGSLDDTLVDDRSVDDVRADAPGHRAEIERDGVRVTMTITIPEDEVSGEVDSVARALRERAKLKGFRRGKAPMSMIRQRFGEEIRDHVLEHLVPDHVSSELSSRGLEPVDSPNLTDVDFQLDGPLRFTVQFDVAPEFELQGLDDLEATRPRTEVTEDMVDRALGNLRERAAELVPAGDDAEIDVGDYVRAEIALFPRDGEGKKLAEENRIVHVGEEEAIPGLNDQMPGLQAGDEREFLTRLGDDYPDDILAGKDVTCRIRVEEIKRRRLPGIDDELAKDLGFEDLDALRAQVREDLAEQLEEQADEQVREQLLAALRESNPMDVPGSLVDRRLDSSMRRTAQGLAQRGLDPNDAIDWRGFRAENRPAAERAVANDLLLDRVADVADIEVEDADVLQEIKRHSERQAGTSAATVVQQMRKDGSFEGLRRAIRRRRALDWLEQRATIQTDGPGEGVDVATPRIEGPGGESTGESEA